MPHTQCRPIAAVSLVGLCLTIVGCNDTIAPPGPCVHEYKSPILEITSAVASDGEPVSELTIRSVTLDGRVVDPLFLLMGPNHGVVLWQGSLLCNVPCGFAAESGHYLLTVEAPGQPTRMIEVDAAYRVFHGGCPSYNDGGTTVNVAF